jgi:predicted metalloprotease with PDZ domain
LDLKRVIAFEVLRQRHFNILRPAWSPGYYRILDYAKNVQNFRAEDATGRALPWRNEKETAA